VVFYQMLGKEMDHCTPRSFLGASSPPGGRRGCGMTGNQSVKKPSAGVHAEGVNKI
jgi:hypothetical protein